MEIPDVRKKFWNVEKNKQYWNQANPYLGSNREE